VETTLSDAAAILGKKGGKSKSSAKAAASRANGVLGGKDGGRPRLKNPSAATLARRKRRAMGKS
jgi:hypothetical protein